MAKRDEKIGARLILVNAMYALGQTWRFSKSSFVVQLINSLYQALNPIASAYIAGAVVGELAQVVLGEPDRGRLLLLIIIAAALQLFYYLFGSATSYFFNSRREYMEMRLNENLLKAQTMLPIEQLELASTRDQISYASTGSREMYWYVRAVMNGISGIVGAVGILVVVFATIPVAALVLLPLPFVSVGLKYRNYKMYRGMFDTVRANRMRADSIERMLRSEQGILEVRLYGLLGRLLGLWKKESQKMVDVRMKDEARSNKASLVIDVLESGIGVAVDIWLVFQVASFAISVSIFEQTRRLVGNYINSLSLIGSAFSDIVLYGYRINDYRTFLQGSVPGADDSGGKAGPPKRLELQGVSYSYPNTDALAIDGVDLKIQVGETVAIVGENGAGKTTLFKVLLGAYTATKGRVLYNDKDIRSLNHDSIYRHVSPLFQDFQEFDFLKIGESIQVAGKKKDSAKLRKVLELVGMWDFVQSQPKKLNANIGYVEEDGIKLSGGQWQRMAIARALYKDAPIMILDEPTSAIDAKSEQEIMEQIFTTYSDRILITVSHRISTVSRADRIVVMKGGKIVEDGTHKTLWRSGTVYYDLFKKQAISDKKTPG